MKMLFVCGVVMFVMTVYGVVVDVPRVPVSHFADGESSKDQTFQSKFTC